MEFFYTIRVVRNGNREYRKGIFRDRAHFLAVLGRWNSVASGLYEYAETTNGANDSAALVYSDAQTFDCQHRYLIEG